MPNYKIVSMEEYIPHLVSEVICIKCRKRWIAVYPEVTWLKDLECENCGPGFVINTGQPIPDEINR